MRDIIVKFANEINHTQHNEEILSVYKKFLVLYSDTNFKDYTFIIGTNDSVGVQSSGDIKRLIKKEYHCKNKENIFTMDLLNSYKYFFILNSSFKEYFGLDLSLFLDTNMAGIFANFIENAEKESHELVKQVARNPYINLNFLFYIYENIHNPNRTYTSIKAYKIFDNLCKFNSIYRNQYVYDKTLNINKRHYTQMKDFLLNNFDEKIFAEYHLICAYLIYAFIEKNSSNFDIKKSIYNILQIMQKNGTNYSELLEFIYSYFKNGNNAFLNVVKTQSCEEIIKGIENIGLDIFFYYSTRHQMTYFSKGADFGFPIFATMDKKFVENYTTLFKNRILTIKDNTLEYCIRKPSKNMKEIQGLCGNVEDHFQRNKLKDETNKYILSQQVIENAKICLKSFLSNRTKQ